MVAIHTNGAIPRNPSGPQIAPTRKSDDNAQKELGSCQRHTLVERHTHLLELMADPQTIRKNPIIQELPS